MPKAPRTLSFLAVLWVLGAALPARTGKSATGTLTGVVLDIKGEPVAAARVFWQTADGARPPHILHADQSGHFSIPSLLPGLYQLRGEAAGKWSEWEHNVLVRGGSESKVILRLVRKSPPPAGVTFPGLAPADRIVILE